MPIIELNDATIIAQAILDEALNDDGAPVTVCVSDAAGNPVLLYRMDGASLGSLQTAQDKCYTAVRFERDTIDLEQAVDGRPGYRDKVQQDPRFCLWAGGAVLFMEHDGRKFLVGAVGVSGRKSRCDINKIERCEDDELANLGRDKWLHIIGEK